MIIGLIFILILVLFYIAKFLISISLYLFFVCLTVLWCVFRDARSHPPALPEFAVFDDSVRTRRVKALVAEWERCGRMADTARDEGLARHLAMTKTSGYSRFDGRSKFGRHLNDRLESAEISKRAAHEAMILAMREAEVALPDVLPLLNSWKLRYAMRLSVVAALKAFAGGFAVFLLWSFVASVQFSAAQQLLVWTPLPRFMQGPAFAAMLLSCVAAASGFYLYSRKLGRVDVPRLDAWMALRDKWSGSPFGNSFASKTEAEPDPEQGERERPNPLQPSGPEPWHVVLGVAPDASMEAIKSAHRAAIKSYHSDKVASLGEKLRVLAEEESKRINVAYDEAHKQRGLT